MCPGALIVLAAAVVANGAAPAPAADRSRLEVATEVASDRLQIELRGAGQTVRCPGLVEAGHPCTIPDSPVGWVELSTDGSRRLAQQIELLPGPNTVRLTHRGYGPALVGAAVAVLGVAFVARGGTGPTLAEDGTSRVYLDVGAVAITVGALLIAHDLLRRHDFVEVSNP
jgi:hypothetical protein